MKSIILILISFCFLFSCNDDNNSPTEIEPTKQFKTIKYKSLNGIDSENLSLDIYYNDDSKLKPIVIYVHGGKWSNPNKNKSTEIANMSLTFQSEDYVFVSVNYRLSPKPYELDNPDRIMFPNHNNDLADAIKWVYDNISEYGGDRSNIGLIGHSAGAHLVALTGTNKYFLNQKGLNLSDIKGVAVLDTKAYDIQERVINAEDTDLYINAFGSNANKYFMASPLLHIDSKDNHPNFLIVKRGSFESHRIVEDFASKLETNSVNVTVVEADQYSHDEVFLKFGEKDEKLVTTPILDFFSSSFNK